jgi:hypothetical protein
MAKKLLLKFHVAKFHFIYFLGVPGCDRGRWGPAIARLLPLRRRPAALPAQFAAEKGRPGSHRHPPLTLRAAVRLPRAAATPNPDLPQENRSAHSQAGAHPRRQARAGDRQEEGARLLRRPLPCGGHQTGRVLCGQAGAGARRLALPSHGARSRTPRRQPVA